MKKLTIIGGGPAGYAAALYATNFDIEVTLIESDTLGGTCLNRGCIPAKYWLHVAELNHEIDTSNEFGIEIKDKNINWQQTAQKRFDTVNKLVSGIGMLLKSKKVTVVEGWGSIKDKNTVNVKKLDGEEVDISSDFILIATGSKPIEIPSAIFGGNIVDSTGALSFEKVPETLGVVGAGIIGLELGSVWSRLGSKVTVIEALDDFLPMADKDISKESLKEFKKQGLDIQLSSKVIKSSEQKGSVFVSYEYQGKEVKKKFDKLIVAVGRYPNSSGVIDKTLNISVNNGLIEVNEFCQTSVSNIWAVGDVVRGPMLAHKGSEEGIMVAERIAEKHAQVNYDLVPSVIYSHPCLLYTSPSPRDRG